MTYLLGDRCFNRKLQNDDEGLRRECPSLPAVWALEDTFPEHTALLHTGGGR